MYCKYCGKEIAEDAKFCPFCGNRRFKKVPPKRSKKAEKNIWEITDGKAYVAHCETRQEASALLDEICGKSEDVTKGTFFGDKIPKYWMDDSVKVNRIEVDDTEIR